MALAGRSLTDMKPPGVLPIFRFPLAVSMFAVVDAQASLGTPLYLVPTGSSSGVSATILTALWVERYGPKRLAEMRSTVSATNVVAS